MWGNQLGWAISAVLAVAMATLVLFISRGGQVTPPTQFSLDSQNFAALTFPEPAPSVMPTQQDCDAAAHYRQAIALVLDHRSVYSNFATVGKLTSPHADKLDAVAPLLEAGACAKMNLFAANPSDIISYAHTKPPLEALDLLGRVCIDRLGLLNHQAGAKAEAKRHFEAGLALGLHLCRERITYDELEVGLQIVSKSTAMLIRLADDANETDRAAALRDFDARRQKFTRQLDPVLRLVRTLDPKAIGPRTGDVFELAKRSKERMWRVEAILALGRIRFLAGEGGTVANQREAIRYVRKLAETDPDPIIRAAAAAARDLTIEQHRMQ